MIITDKYRIDVSSIKDTICQSIEERVGDKWVPLVNIPLHYMEHAEPLWMLFDKHIDDCVMREEAAKDPDENKPSSDTSSDFWPTR